MSDKHAMTAPISEVQAPAEKAAPEKPAAVSLGARIASPFQTIFEFFALARSSGRGWLIPMFGLMLILAVLLVIIQVVEYVAPFVYTIF